MTAEVAVATMPAVEVVVVRCETDAFVCRVRRPVGAAAEASACSEHPCRKCREMLLHDPAFHRMSRRDVAVYHFVSPAEARVVETRAILYPHPESRDLNHGGRRVPRETFDAALRLAGF